MPTPASRPVSSADWSARSRIRSTGRISIPFQAGWNGAIQSSSLASSWRRTRPVSRSSPVSMAEIRRSTSIRAPYRTSTRTSWAPVSSSERASTRSLRSSEASRTGFRKTVCSAMTFSRDCTGGSRWPPTSSSTRGSRPPISTSHGAGIAGSAATGKSSRGCFPSCRGAAADGCAIAWTGSIGSRSSTISAAASSP